MEPVTILLIAMIIMFFAGMMQGLAGFGFSLVSVPILIMLIEPTLMAPMIIIHSIVINFALFLKIRQDAELKRIWPLIVAGIAGLPFGVLLLLAIDPQSFKLIIGIFIVLFGIAYLMDFRKELKNEKLTFMPVGFISGVLNSSITLSGPPVIFCLTNQGVEKKIFRANMISYFLFLNLATIPFFIWKGIFTGEVVNFSLILLPGMILGAGIGSILVTKVCERTFRNIALIVTIGSGLLSIITGLGIFG